MSRPEERDSTPRATLAGVRRGALMTAPLLPGAFFFGAAFGTLAAQKGMTFTEAMLFSGMTFAGASQFAAVEAWRQDWSLAGFVAITAIVGIVNLRFFLMSAALRPWLHALPPSYVYPQFLVLTDMNYILASRYYADGGRDAAVLFGAGLAAWSVWTLSCAPGYLLGALLSQPERFGVDLIMPMMFGAMTVSLWKSHKDTRNWAVAGAAALATMHVAAGQWHIMVGALSGMAAAAFLEKDPPA